MRITIILSILCALVRGDSRGTVISVENRPGETIQAAINRARPGDTVIVNSGTYTENLVIKTDRVSLVGKGAVLVPPGSFVANECSGLYGPDTQAGICIQGSGIQADAFAIEHKKVRRVRNFVRGVEVSGFQIKGFRGAGIGVIGGQDTVVKKNEIVDCNVYGSLSAGSKGTLYDGNTVRQAGPPGSSIGICMDNFGDVRAEENKIDTYSVGLCVQTNGAIIRRNTVTNSCFGIFVDPFVDGARIRDNTVANGSTSCDAGFGFGVWLDGATNSVVKENKFGGLAINVAVQDAFCQFQAGLSCLVNNNRDSISKGNNIEA